MSEQNNKALAIPVEKIQLMAEKIAKSGLFPDINTSEKAFTLMMLCQAEGLHPVMALRRYNIIQNRPAMKADTMLAEFNNRGGKVEWLQYSDTVVEAKFIHPNGSHITVKWDIEMAKKIKQGARALITKDNWQNYPRQMLRARVISEGIRTIMPEVCAGIYTPEEVQDFTEPKTETISPDLQPPKAISTEAAESKENPPQEEKPQQPEPQQEKTPDPNETLQKTKELNARFKRARELLGDEDFFYILRKNKVSKLKDIKTVKQAEKILKDMESVANISEAFDGKVETH